MAVSIDKVYQKVLALANKEQRGYITPQEFNLFADQAQMEIFNQYFYDLEQFKRRPGSEIKFADLGDLILEKIDGFSASEEVFNHTDFSTKENFYRIESVYLSDANTNAVKAVVEKITVEQLVLAQSAPLTRVTKERPLYRFKNNKFTFNPSINSLGNYFCYYTLKPVKPNWGYVVVNDKPLYNSTASTDFELHISEETELVYRILVLAGVAIEKPQLVQTAAGLVTSQIQQEKQ
jgi:hypothetical protein